MNRIYIVLASLTVSSAPTLADWREEADLPLLEEYAALSGTPLPDATGLEFAMVEASNSATISRYLPNAGSSMFSGKTITDITGSNSGSSGHATTVASYYFGNTASLLPSIDTVGVHEAGDFINGFLANTVGSSSALVMSHAYVSRAVNSEGITLQPTLANDKLSRFDFFSIDSNIINVVGVDNSSSNPVPPLWGSSFNSISVGRSDGNHSTGETPEDYESPGRQKPDIVAPNSPSISTNPATSYATGAISSAASLLRVKALSSGNTNASHPDTIKAALLAGATKDEFPNWTQTSTKPLDPIYGAGEVNIFRSYRIIENNESPTGNVNHRGWARNTTKASSGIGIFEQPAVTHTYTFTTPADQTYPTLSTALIWQRPVNTGTYSYGNLANLKLELLNTSDTVIQTSNSSLDNVEHIWNPTLTPNTTYKLRVSSASTTSTNFSLAWIVSGENQINAAITKNPSTNDVELSELLPGTQYKLQRSTNLTTWTTIKTFTAASTTETHTDTTPPSSDEVFYRLRFFHP